MAGIAIEQAWTTGHETAPPTRLKVSQNLVFVEGRRVHVHGDEIIPHAYEDHHPHEGYAIASDDVEIYINGIKVVRIGDRISCGDTISEGSSITIVR